MSRPSDPKCPLCKKPTTPAFKPFCSRGCKDRDLLNWLGGSYALPVMTPVDEDDNPVLDNPDNDGL
jgi:uncharacterized protein